MGLFDVFKKKEASKQNAAETWPVVLKAPVSGRMIAMADIPDPVFSTEVLGKGCAIWPESTVVYAPCAGTVSVVMGHAVGLTSDDGVEVLVHVGVDTVDMEGKGFTGYVAEGAKVKAGDAIAAAGHPDCVVVAISNTAEFSDVSPIPAAEDLVEAGASFDDVVKMTVLLADIDDFAAVNEVYGSFLAAPYPARSAFQVAAIPKGALVEIEAIAVV